MTIRHRSNLTHDQIRQAVERFLQAGGAIETLPSEADHPRHWVGGGWSAYEPVLETAPESDTR